MACLTVHLLKDILVVSSLGILQIKLLWLFMCRFSGQPFEPMPSSGKSAWPEEQNSDQSFCPGLTDLLYSLALTVHF